MVVVEQFALLEGQLVVGAVIVVVVDHGDLIFELIFKPVGEGGFAGAGPPGDADDNRHSMLH